MDVYFVLSQGGSSTIYKEQLLDSRLTGRDSRCYFSSGESREKVFQEDLTAGAKSQRYVTASDVGRTTSSLHYLGKGSPGIETVEDEAGVRTEV